VDADKLRELTHCYARYRQAVTTPTDPVLALSLTGKVLTAVHRVITDPCLPKQLHEEGRRTGE
jgi:hypothetical protein